MTTIRVVIVDDQPLVRSGIRLVLEAADDLVIVGEAADGKAALQLIRQTRPDVALMDLRMPVLDGIATIAQLTRDDRLDTTRYLVLTTFDHDELVTGAIRAGASGYLLKDTSPEQLRQAVRDTAAGNAPLSPTIARHLIAGLADPRTPPARASERLAVLTEREREVLTHVARGLRNDEIAERLVISPETVRTHVGRIMAKLQARDRARLVVIAYETGHVRPGDPQLD
jgi:DNA-binding NarL/FixJ family response regulator